MIKGKYRVTHQVHNERKSPDETRGLHNLHVRLPDTVHGGFRGERMLDGVMFGLNVEARAHTHLNTPPQFGSSTPSLRA